MSIIDRAKTIFFSMIENKNNFNTAASIIKFVTDVVEETAKQLKKNSGKKMTGHEKFELCVSIVNFCLDELFTRKIIPESLYNQAKTYSQNANVFYDLVSGIIEIGKQLKGCCC